MKTALSCAIAVPLLLFASGSGFAACKLPTFEFFPERNDNIVVTGVVARGTTCVHRLGEGPGYHFTDVSAARPPEHGEVEVSNGVTITYRPDPSFQGKDFYQIRACARKTDGSSGCSNLFFIFATR